MKNVYSIALSFAFFSLYAQRTPETAEPNNLSPGGLLEHVFDQYGNKYRLDDIRIKERQDAKPIAGTSLVTTCNPGYFNLYFEEGSGMEIVGNSTHDARRNIICKVFLDISNFIDSPLLITGERVNIWVRKISNVIPSPNGVAGLASSFYNIPHNAAAGFGGIADNEIWRTIHAGKDSYTNVASPISVSGISSGPSGIFYHGMCAFNFNSSPAINWHLNLGTAPSGSAYDLYSVALHEITHALGFASMVNENGASKFNPGFAYYTRYDRFLRNNAGSTPLIVNTGACSVMYNYKFNPALSATILRPGCPLNPPVSSGSANVTNCANAIKYVSAAAVPVYTPSCFEPPSSLSHFEDMLYPSCSSPYGNDNYFSMSNGSLAGITKRYLRPEERTALCDMGYRVKATYGTAGTLNGTFNYGSACSGIVVAGTNDGFNNVGDFTFVGNTGTNIVITGSALLGNDTNATGFECLEDVYGTGTVNGAATASGTSGTSVNFSSSVAGTHLLRYVPVNGSQRGNITYVYVYVNFVNECAAPTACDLIVNGDFEQHGTLVGGIMNFAEACNWYNGTMNATPEYFHTASPSTYTDVPCNLFGSQADNIAGNNGYAGIGSGSPTVTTYYQESLRTKLTTPLLPNTTYQLSFDVSLAEGESSFAMRFQAYLSTTFTTHPGGGSIPIANPAMLFTNSNYSQTSNGWERIVFTFTTGATAGETALYIGALSQFDAIAVTPSAQGLYGCNYGNYNTVNLNNGCYYFIDNVSLVPYNGAVLNFPNPVCSDQTVTGLADHVSGAPQNGTFSGPGITLSGGSYSFDASVAGSGEHVISYTYTNATGCPVTIFSDMLVQNCQCHCLSTMYFSAVAVPVNTANFTIQNSDPTCSTAAQRRYWSWGDGSGAMLPFNTVSHTYAAPGTYTVTVSASYYGPTDLPICTDSYSFPVTVGGSGRNAAGLNVNTVDIYPNPTSGNVNIDLDVIEQGTAQVTVRSLDGRQLQSFPANVKSGRQHLEFTLPPTIAQGVVLIEVSLGDSKVVKRVIVE